MRLRSSNAVVVFVALLALVLASTAACGTTVDEDAPGAPGDAPALEHDEHDEDDGAPISPGADPQEPGGGTTETAWGELWDRLPTGFPLVPGATPSDEAAPEDEPVSGAFVVDGLSARGGDRGDAGGPRGGDVQY